MRCDGCNEDFSSNFLKAKFIEGRTFMLCKKCYKLQPKRKRTKDGVMLMFGSATK